MEDSKRYPPRARRLPGGEEARKRGGEEVRRRGGEDLVAQRQRGGEDVVRWRGGNEVAGTLARWR